MNFSWSEEQLEFKDAVIDFANKVLRDDIINRDKDSIFPHDLWKKCADFGIQGLPFPEKYGGLDLDISTTMLVMEGLGYACKDNGLIFGINAQLLSVQMPIFKFGTEEQKKKYLISMIKGDTIGAHCMSEPDSGSDAFSLRTTAKLNGDHYLLNGTKTFVTNAPVADVFMVFATIDRGKGFMGITGFIVEKDFPGIHICKNIGKMGLRTCPWSEVAFNNCMVPVENRLAKEGGGAAIFNDSMEWERSCILASYIGVMEKQLERCINYAQTRKQFNQPIGKFQSIANKISDMKVRLETARLILYKVAWMKKTKGRAVMDAAIAKLYLSECLLQSSLDAVQIHGGYGYTTEYEVERELRDAIGGTLYSGTSEIQRNIIARQLGL